MSRAVHALNIFGGQGSGKGTQARRLEQQLGIVLIGMGDTLRELATEDTDTGRLIKETIGTGRLVPDELATNIIRERLTSIPKDQGFVMEGYPRTIQQATDYRTILDQLGRLANKPVFIHLTVPEAELRNRLEKRQALEGRHDDIEHLIEQRLRIFQQQTKPVLEAVGDWADVIEVNGNRPIPEVTTEILERIKHAPA